MATEGPGGIHGMTVAPASGVGSRRCSGRGCLRRPTTGAPAHCGLGQRQATLAAGNKPQHHRREVCRRGGPDVRQDDTDHGRAPPLPCPVLAGSRRWRRAFRVILTHRWTGRWLPRPVLQSPQPQGTSGASPRKLPAPAADSGGPLRQRSSPPQWARPVAAASPAAGERRQKQGVGWPRTS